MPLLEKETIQKIVILKVCFQLDLSQRCDGLELLDGAKWCHLLELASIQSQIRLLDIRRINKLH